MNKIAVRQATIADLELIVPLFDAYRQFYRRPADLDLARRFLRDRFVTGIGLSAGLVFLLSAASAVALGLAGR